MAVITFDFILRDVDFVQFDSLAELFQFSRFGMAVTAPFFGNFAFPGSHFTMTQLAVHIFSQQICMIENDFH